MSQQEWFNVECGDQHASASGISSASICGLSPGQVPEGLEVQAKGDWEMHLVS